MALMGLVQVTVKEVGLLIVTTGVITPVGSKAQKIQLIAELQKVTSKTWTVTVRPVQLLAL